MFWFNAVPRLLPSMWQSILSSFVDSYSILLIDANASMWKVKGKVIYWDSNNNCDELTGRIGQDETVQPQTVCSLYIIEDVTTYKLAGWHKL